MSEQKRVFVLDDEKEIVELLSEVLRDDGILVDGYYSVESALARATQNPDIYDYYFVDYHIRGFDGFEFCKHLHYDFQVPVDKIVIMTGDYEVGFELDEKPTKTLYKPFDLGMLAVQIKYGQEPVKA